MHCDTIYKDRGDSCRSKGTISQKKVEESRFSFWQSVKERHPYWNRWLSDAHLRTNVILCGNVLWNAAYVSMFTLEGTMLATFGKEMKPATEQRFLGISGTVVITFILVMALHLILHGNRQIKALGK